jgi:phospholipid/cholesterol/gamma-HCH transport system permease protein
MSWVAGLGRFFLFVAESIAWVFRRPFRWRLVVDEMEFIGNQSLFIVGLTSLFTGAVLAYQSWLALKIVGTDSLVGMTTAISLARELGPVMTGLVVTGRAGAAIAAKIGIMRVTEQIDALEVMAISPQQYLVGPKIVAAVLALPLLTAVFCLMGNFGAYVVSIWVAGIDPGIYIAKLKFYLEPWDLYHGLIKSAVFGFILSTVGAYQGYSAKNGAEGVGKATNQAVVFAMVAIFVVDYFLSVIVPSGYRSQA